MKRYFIIGLFAAASLFALQSPLFAALWYVDGTLNSGSNNGTSWANAWRSFANVKWGTGGVKAGDTLYISGGSESKTYTSKLTVGASGTNGNPITISIGQDSGHNGVAIFDYSAGGSSSTGAAIGINKNYINVTGNVNGKRHIRIQNLYNTSTRHEATGVCGVGSYVSNIIVEYIEVINCNNGIYTSGSSDCIARYNKISVRGDSGITLSGDDNSWDSTLIHDNEIEVLDGTTGGPDGTQFYGGVSLFNNKFSVKGVNYVTSNQHSDYVQVTGNYVKIYNNEFTNIGDSGIDYDVYANPNPKNIWIFNNVFRITEKVDLYPEYIRFYTNGDPLQSITNFKILNNTFVDNTDFATIRIVLGKSKPAVSGNEIKNNIFYNCSTLFSLEQNNTSTADLFSFGNNIYYHPSNKANIGFFGTSYTAANWVANKEPTAKTSQPQFIQYTKNGVNNDFRLAANDTVAIDSGLNLSAYLTTDKSGVARPQGRGFDIGAYEYTGANPQPAPSAPPTPQNLRPVSTP